MHIARCKAHVMHKVALGLRALLVWDAVSAEHTAAAITELEGASQPCIKLHYENRGKASSQAVSGMKLLTSLWDKGHA